MYSHSEVKKPTRAPRKFRLSYLMNLLSLRLVGEVVVRNSVRSSLKCIALPSFWGTRVQTNGI